MPNFSGVTYYKLKSGFQGDITKNCSLTASEVDHNFLFLRGYDVIDFSWDENAKELVLTRVNGDKLVVEGILNSIDASASTYDRDTGTLILNIEGNEFPVTGFPIDRDLDDLKRQMEVLSGEMSSLSEMVLANNELVETLSGNVSELSILLSERMDALDMRVSANTDSIASAQTYINILENYPGVPTLPGLSCNVPEAFIYEVGENVIPRLPDTAITLTEGKFDSKGSVDVVPAYTAEFNENFTIYINGTQYLRNSDFPLTYNVPYGTTHMAYNPVMQYSAPSNLPLTNYDRETSKTGITAEEGSATWIGGIAGVEGLETLIVGRYPCYTNISGDNLVPETPVTKIDVTAGYVKDGWHLYEIVYPPNWMTDIKYEFYFPDVLDLKSVLLDSGVFGKMEVNNQTYQVEPVAPINNVAYNRLQIDSVNNVESMPYWFKLKEK